MGQNGHIRIYVYMSAERKLEWAPATSYQWSQYILSHLIGKADDNTSSFLLIGAIIFSFEKLLYNRFLTA